MNKKSKIIAISLGAVATITVPLAVSLATTACGSGNIDGSDNSQQPDTPVDPSPAPQPQPGPTPPGPDPVEPPAPGPTPPPAPGPTPENVEVSAETLKTINDALVSVVSNMTSEDQVDATKESIKSQLESSPFFTTNKITVATVEMTPVKGSADVKYNVSVTLSSGNKLTLANNEYFNVNGNTISTKNPLATKITVTPTPEPQPEPEKDISFSNDDVVAIATIFTDNLATLNNKDNLEATKQTILSKLNEVAVIKTNNISVDNLQLNEVTVGDQIKYNVSFALSVTPTKPITVPDNETFTIADNQWTSTQPFATAITVTPPTPPVNNKITVDTATLSLVHDKVSAAITGMKSAADATSVQSSLPTEINEIQFFKDNNVTVANVELNKTTTDNIDSYKPSITFNTPADKELVWPESDSFFTCVDKTITLTTAIQASYKNSIAISSSVISKINDALTNVITNLTAPETNEKIQDDIKLAVNTVLTADVPGVQVDSVTVADSTSDDHFKQYAVSLHLTSSNTLDIATDGVLTAANDTLTTKAPVVSKISTQVELTAEDLQAIYNVINPKVTALAASSEIVSVTDSIKETLNTSQTLTSKGLQVDTVNLELDPASTSDYAQYFASVTLSSSDSKTIVYPATNDYFSTDGNTLKTKTSLVTAIKQEVVLDATDLGAISNAINETVSKITDESLSQDQIKTDLTNAINALPTLTTKHVVVNSIELTPSTVENFIAYTVKVVLHSGEKNLTINGTAEGLTVSGPSVTTTNPVKTSISTIINITSAQLDEIYTNVIQPKVSAIASVDQVTTVEADILAGIKGLSFITTNSINVANVHLTEASDPSVDNVQYKVSFDLSSDSKTLSYESNAHFEVTGNTITTTSAITSALKQTVVLETSDLTAVQTAIDSVIKNVTEGEEVSVIQTKVLEAINGVTQLSSKGVSASSATLTKTTSNDLEAYNVSFELQSSKTLQLPATGSGFTIAGSNVTIDAPIETTISTIAKVSTENLAEINQTIQNVVATINETTSSVVNTARNTITEQLNGLSFMTSQKITVSGVTLTAVPAAENKGINYSATFQLNCAKPITYPSSDANFTINGNKLSSTVAYASAITQNLSLNQYSSLVLVNFAKNPLNVLNLSTESTAYLVKNYENYDAAIADVANARTVFASAFQTAIAHQLGVDSNLISVSAPFNNSLSMDVSFNLTSASDALCQALYNKTYVELVTGVKQCADYESQIGIGNDINQIQVSFRLTAQSPSNINSLQVLNYKIGNVAVRINNSVSPSVSTSSNNWFSSKVGIALNSTATGENGTAEVIPKGIVISNAVATQINEYMISEIAKVTKSEWNENDKLKGNTDADPMSMRISSGINDILTSNGITDVKIAKTAIWGFDRKFDESVNSQYEYVEGLNMYATKDSQAFVFEDNTLFYTGSSNSLGVEYFQPKKSTSKAWLLKAIPVTVLNIDAAKVKEMWDLFESTAQYINTKDRTTIQNMWTEKIGPQMTQIFNNLAPEAQYSFGVWGGSGSFVTDEKTGNIIFQPNLDIGFASADKNATSDLIVTVEPTEYASVSTWDNAYTLVFNNVNTAFPRQLVLSNVDVINQINTLLPKLAAKITSESFNLDDFKTDPITTQINALLTQLYPGLQVGWYNNWGGWVHNSSTNIDGYQGSKLSICLAGFPKTDYPGGPYVSSSANLSVGHYNDEWYLCPKQYFKTGIKLSA